MTGRGVHDRGSLLGVARGWGWGDARTSAALGELWSVHRIISHPGTDSRDLPLEKLAEVPAVLRDLAAIGGSLDALGRGMALAATIGPGGMFSFGGTRAATNHGMVPVRPMDGSMARAYRGAGSDARRVFVEVARAYLAALGDVASIDAAAQGKAEASAVGVNMRRARVRCGMSTGEAGAEAGIEPSLVAAYEEGDGIPDVGTLTRLGRLYGVDAVHLRDGPRRPGPFVGWSARMSGILRGEGHEARPTEVERDRFAMVVEVDRLARLMGCDGSGRSARHERPHPSKPDLPSDFGRDLEVEHALAALAGDAYLHGLTTGIELERALVLALGDEGHAYARTILAPRG